MTTLVTPAVATAAPVVCCTVAARSALLLATDELPAWRRAIHPWTGDPLSPSLLKNSDEQTVAAVAAVLRALADAPSGDTPLACASGWGVIAAPRFLGRGTMGSVLHRFREEGAWGISPHLIPHRSLHSVSGTLSLVLESRGPNLGVGGGPGAESEAFAIAAGWLACADLPGLWVVLTGYEPELIPEDPGTPTPSGQTPAPSIAAVALALTPSHAHEDGWQLRIGGPASARATEPEGHKPLLTLERLRCVLAANAPGRWSLEGGCWMELQPNADL